MQKAGEKSCAVLFVRAQFSLVHGSRVVLCPWHEVTLVGKHCSNAKFPVGMCLEQERALCRGTCVELFWGWSGLCSCFTLGVEVEDLGGLKFGVWELSPGAELCPHLEHEHEVQGNADSVAAGSSCFVPFFLFGSSPFSML